MTSPSRLPRPVRLAALLTVPLLFLAACGSDAASTPRADNGACQYPDDGQAAKPVEKPPGDLPEDAPEAVTIATDRGDVKVSLDADKAPCAVNSFLSLAEQGYFDDSECIRLTTEGIFVLQCGDPSGTQAGGPGYSFADELVEGDPRLQPCLGQQDPNTGAEVCTYTAGTVAMANGGPDSNGSQFFLVYQDSPLPAAYTVLGRMSAAGVQVVQEIAKQGTGPDGVAPEEPVTITSVG